MVMKQSKITASKLKAQLLGVLDEVSASGRPVVVTKFGKPVARLVPVDEKSPLAGSVTFLVSEDELIRPIDADWDADAK